MRIKYHTLKSVVFLSVFLMWGCGGDDEDSASSGTSTTASYETRNLPSTYKVEVPDSLQAESTSTAVTLSQLKQTNLARLTGQLSTEEITGYGYGQITAAVEYMDSRHKQMDPYFFIIDAAFDSIQEMCGSDSPCSIGDGEITITITQQMVNAMKDEIRSYWPSEEYMDDTLKAELDLELALLDALVGNEQVLPAITYTDLSDEDNGYDHSVSFDYNSSDFGYGTGALVVSWAEDGSKILFVQDWDDSGAEYEGYGSKGKDILLYDGDEGKMTLQSSYEYDSSKNEQTITLRRDNDSDKNGVIVEAVLSGEGYGLNYKDDIKGYADDDGGYIETSYTWSEQWVDLAGTIVDGDYIIVPDTVATADASWLNAIGYIYSIGGVPSTQYWGPSVADDAVLTGIKIVAYSYSYEANDWVVGNEVSGVTLTGGGTITYQYDYKEAFDANGVITAASWRSGGTGEYTLIGGSFDDSSYDDTYEDSGAAYEVIDVTVSGVDGSYDVAIVKDGLTPGDDNWEAIIGWGYWDGSQYFFSYWGNADDVGGADAYYVSYDYELEDPYIYTRVEGATVSQN